MEALRLQVGKAYRFGLHPKEPAAQAELPTKEALFLWQMELRNSAHVMWKELCIAEQKAGKHAPKLPREVDEYIEQFSRSILIDLLVSYLPPIRGSCIRTLQVGLKLHGADMHTHKHTHTHSCTHVHTGTPPCCSSAQRADVRP